MPDSSSSPLSHVGPEGAPRMVDVSTKAVTVRQAVAAAEVFFPPEAWEVLAAGDWQTAKGAVLPTAVVAGTQAVKRTADLIPFCHPLPLEGIRFTHDFPEEGLLRLRCEVRTTARTGVEMEAYTGASVAALTVIDMTKALSPALEVRAVRLLEKTGGKADYHR
jgi:cyclic pyranopterin phosphate synthase